MRRLERDGDNAVSVLGLHPFNINIVERVIARFAKPLCECVGIARNLNLGNANILATEDYVNNNDGSTTLGETAQPANLNTVGNLSVGADNGVDLLKVGLNTFGVSVPGNSSVGDGAKLNVGTITFETDLTGQTALLEVDGMNDVKIT